MSLVDEPIVPQEGVPDSPIPEFDSFAVTGETADLKALRFTNAMAIKAESDGTELIQAFQQLSQLKEGTGKTMRQLEASRFQEQTFHDARQLFAEQSLNPEAPEEGLLAIRETEAELAEKQGSVRFPIEMYVEAISKDIPEGERRELAVRLHLMETLSEMVEDISGLEIVRDVALDVLIAPKPLWDAMQAFGSLNPIKARNTFRKFAHWFQELSPEDKLAYFPAIQEHIVEAMPRHRAAVMLQAMIDPAFQAEADLDLGVFGTVDALAVGVGITAGLLKLRKLLNPIKVMSQSGSKDRASEANLLIMQGLDDGLGEAAGVNRTTAQTNALPFHGTTVDTAADDYISPAVHERIFAFRDRLKQAFGDLSEGNTFVREGFLDDQDRTKAIVRLTDEYNIYVATRFQGKDKIVKLTGQKETSEGVEFSFEVTNLDGTVVKDTYRGLFAKDDIGFWQAAPRKSVFFSEKAQANKTDFMSTVKAAIRLDNTAAAVSTQLQRVVRDASKPIRGLKGKPRNQRIQEVDDVLVHGDDLEKEFTPQQLKAGVNGVKLDEDQIEYYYNMRGVVNGLGILRNMEARRVMQAREVKTISVGGENFFGEVISDPANAARRLMGKNAIWKYDPESGGKIEVARLNMGDEYAKGFRLVRLEEDAFVGSNRYQHVLVKSDTVSDLPEVVLDLKKGYIPRVNPKATYYVQAFSPSSVDGVQSVIRKAVRSFDNKKEADAFASQMFATSKQEGFPDATTFRVVEDGELEAFRAGDTGISQTGGLIYGKRARTKIPHNNGDASDVPRTSALESIELYLENSKNYMTRSEWRMGLREKWENTAQFHLGGTRVSFDDPGVALANTDLRNLHEKITEFSGFMDKSERAWEQTVKGVYEWSIDKAGRNRISDFILTQRHKDPLTRLRSATFHTLLGMFNPIQLWVQAQGAAVAMSMNITNPAKLGQIFQRQGGLAMIQHVDFNDSSKINTALAKTFGFSSVDELKAYKSMWDRSGLYDSTLSSADVEAAARGYPTSGDALKKFLDSGLMFFRAGELFNRRFAFLTAVDELGGVAKVQASDTLFKEALSRTNDLILNLGKANRASWQKGFLSVPTQFMQIQTKTIESILGLNGALTGPERMKLLMGQFALYGAAGMFGGQWALRQIASASGMDQIDVNEMDEGVLRAFTGGLTDWFLYQMGADTMGSDRGSLLNGMDQTLLSLFTDEMSAFEWMGGPSAVGPERFWRKLRQVSTWFATPQDINGQVSFAAEDVTDTLRFMVEGARGLALSPFATGRQMDMYFLMRDLGQLRDKNGNLIAAPREGFNWQTEWATLMGFKPEILQRKFDLSTINEELRKHVEFRTTVLLEAWDSFLMDVEKARSEDRELSDDELRRHRKRRQVIVDSISDPGIRQQVMKSFRNKLTERRAGGSQIDRQMQKFYDNMVLDITSEFTGGTRLVQTREQSQVEAREE